MKNHSKQKTEVSLQLQPLSEVNAAANLPIANPPTWTKNLEVQFREFIREEVASGDPSPDTIDGYTSAAKHFLSWLVEQDIIPSQVQRKDIIRYRNELLGKRNLSRSTVAYYLGVARRVLDAWCRLQLENYGIAISNPASKVSSPRERRSPEERINYLTIEQLQQLVDSVSAETIDGKRDKLILILMSKYGLRTIEVHRLNTSDLEKVGSDWTLYIRGKNHDRRVYLLPDTVQLLQEYIKGRSQSSEVSIQPLFLSRSTRSFHERLTRRGIRAIIDRYLVQNSLKEVRREGSSRSQVTAHTLRHTFATLALSNGASLAQLQAAGGWINPMTVYIYAHILNRAEENPSKLIPLEERQNNPENG